MQNPADMLADLLPVVFVVLFISSVVGWLMFLAERRISRNRAALNDAMQRNNNILRADNDRLRKRIFELSIKIRDYANGEGWKHSED